MATVIIPARWASSRFPGKPLVDLAGKPLLQHTWESCHRAKSVRQVIIATDDMRIAERAFAFGAEVALTKKSHPSGTDRVAEVAARLSRASVIINVQGDEPFVDPRLIDRLAALFGKDRKLAMATAAGPIQSREEFLDPNCVKVVTDKSQNALYFSRAPIPCDRDAGEWKHAMHHHGIYAYKRKFLLQFVSWKPTPLEKLEKLEQLRALENGAKIQVIRARFLAPGIDTPEQAAAAAKLFAAKQVLHPIGPDSNSSQAPPRTP